MSDRVLFVGPRCEGDGEGLLLPMLVRVLPENIEYEYYPGELPKRARSSARVLAPLQAAWCEWWAENGDSCCAVVCFGEAAIGLVLGRGKSLSERRGRPKEIGEGRKVWVIPTLEPGHVARTGNGHRELRTDLMLLQRVLDGRPMYETIPLDRMRIIDPDPQLRANRDAEPTGRVWMEEMYSRIERARQTWDDSDGPFAVAVDIETEGLDFWARRLWSIGFCWCAEESWAANWGQLRHSDDERRWLLRILRDFPLVVHNSQFDVPFLAHHLGCSATDINCAWDTQLLSYLLNERRGGHKLKRLATDRLRAPEYEQEFRGKPSRRSVPWRAAWAVIEHMIGFELHSGSGRDTRAWGDELLAAQREHHAELFSGRCNQSRRLPADGPRVWTTDGIGIPEEKWRRHVGPDGKPARAEEGGAYCDVQQERQELLRYNAIDCWYTWRLLRELLPEADAEGQLPVYEHIIRPATGHFAQLQLDGMQVDLAELRKVGQNLCEQLEHWEAKLLAAERLEEAAGPKGFSLRSPTQVARYLYDVLKLRRMHARRADDVLELDEILAEIRRVDDEEAQDFWRAQSSRATQGMKTRATSGYMLWWLAQQHEWPRWLAESQVLLKRFGAYVQGVWLRLDERNRLHPTYRIDGTETGRLSSSDPNVHGIPRDPEIKRMFVADPGHTLVAADYSQAEIRMLAHLARDEKLTRVLREADIHTRISCELFRVTPEQLHAMDKERVKHMRRAAKAVAFGIMYGRTPKGLAPQLGVSVEEAEEYVERFRAMMPRAASWSDRQQTQVFQTKESRSLYGRRRRFPVWSRGIKRGQLRQGLNMPVQSSVSDMTVLANLRVIEVLRQAGIGHKAWPHIHDGFLIQVKEDDVERAWRLVAATMAEPGFPTDVPFVAEIATGKSWGDCKEVWEGLKPEGLTKADEELLATAGAAPDFAQFAEAAEA